MKPLTQSLLAFALSALFAVNLFADPPAATLYKLNGGAASTLSSGTTVMLGRLGSVSSYNLTLNSGTAAYTVNLGLSDAAIHAGDVYLIAVSYPASANPTLNVFDSGTSGTLLDSSTGTAIAGSTTLEFVNTTGTGWVAFHKGAILSKNLGSGVQAALGQPVNTSGGLVTGSGLASGTTAYSGTAGISGTAGWLASGAFGNTVIYANQLPGIHLNSNVWTGGGTDDRATLQAALNAINAAGGGTLVMTGAALISGSLALWSNEQIVGLNEGSCGLYLATSSDNCMITNVHRSWIQASDSNIAVENLTVNGNGQPTTNQYNQSHNYPAGPFAGNYVSGIEFNGVNHVKLDHVECIDARCYAFDCSSCNWIDGEHLVAFWHCPDHNNDTVHLDAPYNDVVINDIWGNGLDDEIAIDGDECSFFTNSPSVDCTGTNGAGARVRVSNISCPFGGIAGNGTACEPGSAVRIISVVGRADDIVVSNVHGYVRAFGVLIDSAGRTDYTGNVGSVTLSDIDLRYVDEFGAGGFPYQQLIGVSDRVDTLTLRNIGSQNLDGTYGPLLYLDSRAQIRDLVLSGQWHDESFTTMSGTEGRIMVHGAYIHNFHLGPLQWEKPEGSGSGGIVMNMDAGQIDALTLDDVATNNGVNVLDQTGGHIGAINVESLVDRAAAGPSIVLSDTNTNVTVGSASVGVLLSGSAPALLSGTGNVVATGTGNYPAGRYAYGAIYHLNEPDCVSANDSGPNFGASLLPLATGIASSGTGPFTNCYSFTSGNAACLIGPIIIFPKQFWFSTWVKFSTLPTGATGLFAQWRADVGQNCDLQTWLTASGTNAVVNLQTVSTPSTGYTKASSHGLATNAWHLVLIEYDGVNNVIGISVDGNAMEMGATSGTLRQPTGGMNFTVGPQMCQDNPQTVTPLSEADLVYHPNSLPSSADISALWNGGAGLAAPYP